MTVCVREKFSLRGATHVHSRRNSNHMEILPESSWVVWVV